VLHFNPPLTGRSSGAIGQVMPAASNGPVLAIPDAKAWVFTATHYQMVGAGFLTRFSKARSL
jgi:hypothetical protein